MSSPRKTILVTGATGKQGGALIKHLLAAPDAGGFNILAVTRDASAPRAIKLASNFNVSVITGDLDNPAALFDKAPGPVWGVYSVQINDDAEERQGKALVDAAAAHGVRHFVYSSSDRGGPVKSETNVTTVKNFAAKYHIEKHLYARAATMATPMTYTILRPATFMENLTPDHFGRGFARMWEQMGAKKLQFVSTDDIGWFAANSFMNPEKWRNVAVSLAGDELSQPEGDVLFRAAVGSAMPLAPCPLASAVKFFMKGTLGDMFKWFEHEGYGVDVDHCREMYPQMKTFRTWINENHARWSA